MIYVTDLLVNSACIVLAVLYLIGTISNCTKKVIICS